MLSLGLSPPVCPTFVFSTFRNVFGELKVKVGHVRGGREHGREFDSITMALPSFLVAELRVDCVIREVFTIGGSTWRWSQDIHGVLCYDTSCLTNDAV